MFFHDINQPLSSLNKPLNMLIVYIGACVLGQAALMSAKHRKCVHDASKTKVAVGALPFYSLTE